MDVAVTMCRGTSQKHATNPPSSAPAPMVSPSMRMTMTTLLASLERLLTIQNSSIAINGSTVTAPQLMIKRIHMEWKL